MRILARLNERQVKAVKHKDGALIIIAGAGSGKTTVLTHRIAYLIQEHHISPFNILAITFTNKAAKEMKERVCKATPKGREVWLSTFHSMCARILRTEIDVTGVYDSNFAIYDTDDSTRVVSDILKDLNLSKKKYKASVIQSIISKCKNKGIIANTFKSRCDTFIIPYPFEMVAGIFREYQKRLRDNNALDFDDLLLCLTHIFKRFPKILQRYQDRFQYIMVDEYQDTNTVQYNLVNMLAEKYGNLCVVGDDDQSIYAFRGADISNIHNFRRDYPNAKVIKLEQNYRSTPAIIDASNEVIKNNRNRMEKKMWTEKNEKGADIEYIDNSTDSEEASRLVEKIKEKQAEGITDIAVLYRTNVLTRLLEQQLVLNNIPYTLFNGTKFYERREIKDILAYLKVIINTRDNLALKRVINVPTRGIGETTVDELTLYSKAHKVSLFEATSKGDKIYGNTRRATKVNDFNNLMNDLFSFADSADDVTSIIYHVILKTKYMNYISDDTEIGNERDTISMSRQDNIRIFLERAKQYDAKETGLGLGGFLEEIALLANTDKTNINPADVKLITGHSAKGLEFDVVFILGCDDGLIPHERAIRNSNPDQIEEERRLFYVMITRAKKHLYISTSNLRMMYGKHMYYGKSRFLNELPSHEEMFFLQTN